MTSEHTISGIVSEQQITTLLNIGHYLRDTNALNAAEDQYTVTAQLAQSIGSDDLWMIALLRLSDVLRIKGEYAKAMVVFSELSDRMVDIEDTFSVTDYSRLLQNCDYMESKSDVLRSGGDFAAALEGYQKARDGYLRLGQFGTTGIVNTLISLGDTLLATGDLKAARACYEDAIHCVGDSSDPQGALNAYFGILRCDMDAYIQNKEMPSESVANDYSERLKTLLQGYESISDELGMSNVIFLTACLAALTGLEDMMLIFTKSRQDFEDLDCPLNRRIVQGAWHYFVPYLDDLGCINDFVEDFGDALLTSPPITMETLLRWPLEHKGSLFLTTDL